MAENSGQETRPPLIDRMANRVIGLFQPRAEALHTHELYAGPIKTASQAYQDYDKGKTGFLPPSVFESTADKIIAAIAEGNLAGYLILFFLKPTEKDTQFSGLGKIILSKTRKTDLRACFPEKNEIAVLAIGTNKEDIFDIINQVKAAAGTPLNIKISRVSPGEDSYVALERRAAEPKEETTG